MKYYGTVLNGYYIPNEIKEKYDLGNPGRDQYRLVVKAKSFAAANRFAHEVLNLQKVFTKDYTSETGNKLEIEQCDQYGGIIGSVIGRKYYDLKIIAEEVKEFKSRTNK